MQIVHTIADLAQQLAPTRRRGGAIGFVPTMGALHPGHLALVEAALAECDTVVASIFVNPLQFNQQADFNAYPQRLEADASLLRRIGCQVLFAPSVAEMYPQSTLRIHFGELQERLEGAMRPGHFAGVGIVVAKLLHIVQPAKAYFGQKDLQQLAVVRMLVRDLSIQTEIIGLPTQREPSGLALSSRNERLSAQGRAKAARLYESLQMAQALLPVMGLPSALEAARTHIQDDPAFTLEYLEAVHPDTFVQIQDYQSGPLAICVAAWLEGVRLIDNILISKEIGV